MCVMEEVRERLSIFPNLYDYMRIVDPINKRVVKTNYDNDTVEYLVEYLEEACYGYWNKNEFCENCISMRAYIQNDTCVKIEYKGKSIIFIIATPVKYNGETFILEIIKDISKNTVNSGILNDSAEAVDFLLKGINYKLLRDELTGIYNRRYMSERLPVDIGKCVLEKTPLSIIMADIDFFKNINDTYGHVIGDRVLRDFAAFLAENIDQNTSWAARYGGEEFIIVMNNTNIHAAYEMAEKIRKELEQKVFIYEDIHIKITSSFGVHCIEGKNNGVDDLINEADKNLYKAKQSGRNMTIK